MALKQPPYRPPPQVFGPMWTVLYGLMGFAAYRAWTTGINSYSPSTIELTKVTYPARPCLVLAPDHKRLTNTLSFARSARRDPLHDPARPQPDLDATLLPAQAAHRSHRRHRPPDRSHRLPDLHLGPSGRSRGVGDGAVFGLVGVRDLSVCKCKPLPPRAPSYAIE